ncbi:DNA-binding protein [Enterococcus faecalis]|uniref:DNA-binding protein n=2 Tax=Enterococcus TaxID=1350 RepID=UPI00215BEA89|nr:MULTISPECIES: DNA-binding protein [Enterococcus]MDQ8609320.1 DNA-binding protein [Enterococcus sp. FR088]MDT2164556.1 DNA-binding protein [Enterococcus faecalis]UYY37229.1 DNA-binding protein [Enterococcus faecalis]UYY40046.1 DNA-binding protein [Enterococcus faecalis]
MIESHLTQYTRCLLLINKLPLVLTTEDLKNEFQISNSTLNRLIKLTDFPPCWYGIRGHYSKDEVISWYKKNDYRHFKEQMKALRSL